MVSTDGKTIELYPFFDPVRNGATLSWATKTGIALATGAAYLILQYFSFADKTEFVRQYCWALGTIISTATLAVYIATAVFRRSLVTIYALEIGRYASEEIVSNWLTDRWYVLAGSGFATLSLTVAHLLGIPAAFHASVFSIATIYIGIFAAGFATGMGLLGILAIIALYLRFAPNLQYALNPQNPDGIGGIKKLGDSLWFFGALTGVVGLLISIYMFGVQWTNVHKGYLQNLFMLWVSLPYIFAVSIVLIPGLAVRRQIGYFKRYREMQLKREKARIYLSYKKFDAMEDDAIIEKKKELKDRLNRIQEELENLRKMRNSHIDRQP